MAHQTHRERNTRMTLRHRRVRNTHKLYSFWLTCFWKNHSTPLPPSRSSPNCAGRPLRLAPLTQSIKCRDGESTCVAHRRHRHSANTDGKTHALVSDFRSRCRSHRSHMIKVAPAPAPAPDKICGSGWLRLRLRLRLRLHTPGYSQLCDVTARDFRS